MKDFPGHSAFVLFALKSLVGNCTLQLTIWNWSVSFFLSPNQTSWLCSAFFRNQQQKPFAAVCVGWSKRCLSSKTKKVPNKRFWVKMSSGLICRGCKRLKRKTTSKLKLLPPRLTTCAIASVVCHCAYCLNNTITARRNNHPAAWLQSWFVFFFFYSQDFNRRKFVLRFIVARCIITCLVICGSYRCVKLAVSLSIVSQWLGIQPETRMLLRLL